MVNDKLQLWNDYMLLRDYISREGKDYPTKLHSSVLRLNQYWTENRPEDVKSIYNMLQDTGVRGRVVDFSKKKLPKIDF